MWMDGSALGTPNPWTWRTVHVACGPESRVSISIARICLVMSCHVAGDSSVSGQHIDAMLAISRGTHYQLLLLLPVLFPCARIVSQR